MRRFYVPPDQSRGDVFELPEREARHATQVLRLTDGDDLTVLNGAGAMGMAFADALIDHADVHVTLVDRRHAAGGHWQDAYPFVQLHQASVFYGVASTVLAFVTWRASDARAIASAADD